MARISLLFSLTFVLALGSLFLSVSGHATTPMPSKKPVSPKTVSELQTLPFTQITEILNRTELSAPKTAEFKTMFTLCKEYVAYLESVYKLEKPIVDVLGIAKAKYILMTKAILTAQGSVSGNVNKETSLKLKKTYDDLTKTFPKIIETIINISAKHQYNANAEITAHESKKINHAMMIFKKSINNFMKVVNNLDKKKLGHHARSLEETRRGRFKSAFHSFFNKFGGYMGGKTHGRELAETEYNANSHVGADVKGFEAVYEKFSHFFGNYLGGDKTHVHGRELYVVAEAPAEANAASPSGETDNYVPKYDHRAFDNFYRDFFGPRGKSHRRGLYLVGPYTETAEAPAGVNAASPSGERVIDVDQDAFDRFYHEFFGPRGKSHRRGLYMRGPAKDFFKGFGGKVQHDAAGKMKVAGEDGFRSLNRAHYKHFASTEA